MMRKFFLVLVVFAAAAGAFAQTDVNSNARNTITLDFGPTIVGAAIGSLGDIIAETEEDGMSTSGFGIAVQYERQLFDRVSAAGRIAYLSGGLSMVEEDGGLRAVLGMDISSFSLEGHLRLYPFGGTFFLDGMVGYGNMTVSFYGEVIEQNMGMSHKESVTISASRGYFKTGAKLGWRTNLSPSGGFTFETAFGYYYATGMGDTIIQQFSAGTEGGSVGDDEMVTILENIVFVGGPRVTFAFGWRF